jgi:nucleoside-diphosphate-sugar epimerase
MARQMQRWNPRTTFVGFRISNIFGPADYTAIPSYWSNPELRQWNLWSWVDSRDVAQACRLALEAEITGAHVVTIAAADTLMRQSSRELLASAFPSVPVRKELGEFETLLSIDAARRLLGYRPRQTWRTGGVS